MYPRQINDRLIPSLALLILIITSLSASTCQALTYDYTDTINDVVDGDSFWGTSGREYRLADVSAPEWDAPDGPASTANLESLILNKLVYVDIDGTMTYGRYVCVIYTDYSSTQYLNINKAQWSGGFAVENDHPNAWNPFSWTLYVPKSSPPPPLRAYTMRLKVEGSGFTNPTPGTYTYLDGVSVALTATPATYWSFSHWQINNKNSTEPKIKVIMNENMDITAFFTEKPTCTISINVTDTSHKPLPGVLIVSDIRTTTQNKVNIELNNNGEGSINLVREGLYTLTITKTGYKPENLTILLSPGENESFNVVLDALPVDVKFTLLDLSGKPLKGVSFESMQTPTNQAPVGGFTNNLGVLSLEGLKPGSYLFKVGCIWVSNFTWPVELATSGYPQMFSRIVQSFGVLSFRVVDDLGRPLQGVGVDSVGRPEDQFELRSMGDGEFWLITSRSGDYRLRFSKAGYRDVDFLVSLSGGSSVDIGSVMVPRGFWTFVSENRLLALSVLALLCVLGFVTVWSLGLLRFESGLA